MSYNPVAKQATAANANKTNAVASTNDASATAGADDSMFKTRTFDVFWVDKTALMYKDGFAKVRQSYRIEYGAFCAGVWSGAFLHSFIPKFLMIFSCNLIIDAVRNAFYRRLSTRKHVLPHV